MIKWSVFWFLASSVCCAQGLKHELNPENATALARVPMECILKEYPNKLNQVLADSTDLQSPSELHPIFYGCFDWHSSVHGHWMLVKLMNKFPDTDLEKEIIAICDSQFTPEKVQRELDYFQPELNRSFERTYGWAWYLKLIAELHISNLNTTHNWTKNLQPLTDQLTKSLTEFLPKLLYPIRVGEHTNTAFALSLALDYARIVGDAELEELISERSKTYFMNDKGCPIGWEPSGFDFISPCLQEAELMSKVLDESAFIKWLKAFMPEILKNNFSLEPGKVADRKDGKLVHLDGLNFCRAWCFYTLATVLPKQKTMLVAQGDRHIMASKDQIIGANYMGSHWLASFYVKALEAREKIEKK